MTDAFLFAGPTLPQAILTEKLGKATGDHFALQNGKKIHIRPPASEGDVVEAVRQGPSIIAIVDGFFENIPAIWHKEILYAMSQGVHVMGASSMGALRAAELAPFGMEGVGKIYRAYAEGRWQDDDEVTVVHGPAELGFPAVSEAMANIRATFDHALHTKAIALAEWAALTSIAKQLFYKERTYGNILRAAASRGMDVERARWLELWFSDHRVDQKQADALELLDIITTRLYASIEKKKVIYDFQDTVIWRKARSLSNAMSVDGG